MKKIFISLVLATLLLSSCKKYFDINSNPETPQNPDVTTLLTPVFSQMARSLCLDSRYMGAYVQYWHNFNSGGDAYDIHGGNPINPSGATADIWQRVYLQIGVPANLIINKGIKDQNWDYVGVAFALKAWAVQEATDYCGEMPFTEAWKDKINFPYDDQATVYRGIDSMLRMAEFYLSRTDGTVSNSSLKRADIVYGGNRSKWLKFVYGLMARRFQRLTNKAEYSADSVIKYVDLSFSSAADNFIFQNTATRNDDSNPFGLARNNFTNYRQGRYITELLDGTIFYGNPSPANRDPRLSRMLTKSFDTTTISSSTMPVANGGYRYLIPATSDPNSGNTTSTSAAFRQRVSTLYGDSIVVITNFVNNFSARVGKYIFQNNAPSILMAYHELQFIKAEAAMRKATPDRGTAYVAYLNGINAHFDFVNSLSNTASPSISAISGQERSAYLASLAVEQSQANLSISDIIMQKYIGDFGWNTMEAWCDMRRFHYLDLDPTDNNTLVYKNFRISIVSVNNLGFKFAYRFRPTGVSENDWNLTELRRIGALNQDYHTYEMWFSQP